METVVLPAQDHLAQERYRQQHGAMSGIIYPLGGLPRTRRKVKSPHQVFVTSTLNTDYARSSDKSNVLVTDSRSRLASPMDMSLGVLCNDPSAASISHLPHSSVLKTPQYRLNNTTPHEVVAHECSSKMLQQQQQLASSLSIQPAVPNGMSVAPRQIMRTRSDGVLGESLQQQGLKRGVANRKKVLEKGADSSKNSAEKTLGKVVEKSSDRKKGLDRRPVEKKPIAVTNASQWDKSNAVEMKARVITILRRPQTKEAAAENMAMLTGRPIEGVTKQILKSALAMSQHVLQQTGVEVELVKGVEVRGIDGEIESVQSRSSTNVSPKIGTKKKLSRDFSVQAASRAAAAEVAQVESQRTEDAGLHGEARRPKTATRRRSDNSERCSDEYKLAAKLGTSAEQDAWEVFKSLERDLRSGHTPLSSVDGVVPWWSGDEASSTPAVLHPGSSDSLVGAIGQGFARQGWVSRSGRIRDVSRGNDNGVELLFLPLPPPNRSERWAGPAYTNSPPPSTLPFPTFPIQREKTSPTEVTVADVVLRDSGLYTNLETLSASTPPSPTRVASLFLSATTMQSPFVDPSSATKDLRRMLNLDVADSFDVNSAWSTGGVESATRSLKRILQLG